MTQPTALVLGGGLAPLTATRRLAGAGYRVIVGSSGGFSIARHSRYCDDVWTHPPWAEAEGFVAAVLDFLSERAEIGTVMAFEEPLAVLLAEARARFPGHVVLATPSAEMMHACIDKDRLYEVAHDVGVPYPETRRVARLDDIATAAREMGLPIVIKPNTRVGQPLRGRKAIICFDERDLKTEIGRLPPDVHDLLVQRFVQGPRQNVHFIARDGTMLARVQAVVRRTDQVDDTGVSVSGATVVADQRLDDYCRALIEAIDFTGVGVANFLLPAGQAPQLLEVNPRVAGTYRVAEEAGLEQTLAAVGLATDPKAWRPRSKRPYRVGITYAWTSRELYGIAAARSRGDVTTREAVRWLGRAMRGAVATGMHLTWSWRDPIPTFAVLLSLVRTRPWRATAGAAGRQLRGEPPA